MSGKKEEWIYLTKIKDQLQEQNFDFSPKTFFGKNPK